MQRDDVRAGATPRVPTGAGSGAASLLPSGLPLPSHYLGRERIGMGSDGRKYCV
jgi:hypothetical protein